MQSFSYACSHCRFVMVKFLNDTIVQPKESQWFEFYEPGQDQRILPLNQSKVYKNVSQTLTIAIQVHVSILVLCSSVWS